MNNVYQEANPHHSRYDIVNPMCILALSIIGVLFIYSARMSDGGIEWVKQVIFIAIGAIVYITISLWDYKILMRHGHWVYFLAILLLTLVVATPLGHNTGGATRWLNLGFYKFQPVELAKLGALIITASILTRTKMGNVRESFEVLAIIALAVSILFLLILLQPDLSSALTIPFMVFALLYVSNLSTNFFVACFATFVLVLAIVAFDMYKYNKFLTDNNLEPQKSIRMYEKHSWIPLLGDFQRVRILTWWDSDRVGRKGAGWNLEQSIISVASGGATGKGYTKGLQAQLGYLPKGVSHNDFIFSVIAEETGFVGSGVVISLFGLLLFNCVRIASIARDRFGTLLVVGVVSLMCVHIFVNIAMTIGMVPITGLPLPFISNGGTFFISCCALLGIVQSVYRFRKDFS